MTVPQLLHALAAAATADEQPDWFCWRFRTSDGRFEFTPRPELALEPVDAGRHVPKGRPQLKAVPNRAKRELEVERAPRLRYKLFLADVPARVSDDDLGRLNTIGDAARKYVIQDTLDKLEETLKALTKKDRASWSF
jgi:hypothetical protein